MSLSSDQLADYTKHIDGILDKSDLTTVSVKGIRTRLQDIIGDEPQLSTGDLKPVINGLIQERFAVAEDRAGIKHEPEDDEPPVKKRKTSAVKAEKVEYEDDADEKLAALLQAEENSRTSRSTRGARAAKAAPKKAPVKRKKKEKEIGRAHV